LSVTGPSTTGVETTSLTAGGPSASWAGLVSEHKSYIESKKDKWLVFRGDGQENAGDLLFSPYTHRWTQGYTKRQYAKMHDFIRGAREDYADPHIVILPAMTASTTTPVGNPRPPLDHFHELKNAWSRGVRYELSHSMNADRKKDRYPARDWEYIQIWEPTTDKGNTPGGYAHHHTVVVCDGEVGQERFRSVIEKHVEKCEHANHAAHDPNKTDIRPLDNLNNPAAYLFKYLGKSWQPSESPRFQQRFDALLWETEYRRFQPSQGAQRWMKEPESEADEPWMYLGIGDDDDREKLQDVDARAFEIDNEMSVSAYLAGREATEMQPMLDVDTNESLRDRCEHDKWHRGKCINCGISTRELNGSTPSAPAD
jgi:hypothetical protein